MAQILIRNLSEDTVQKLKQQAKRNNRSLEAEVREILEFASMESATPEYKAYTNDVLAGRAKRDALLDYLERSRARAGPQTSGSAEIVRQGRDELDAKFR